MQHRSANLAIPGSSQQGFSLVEVLVAIAVMIVGIVAVIEMFPPGFLSISAADTRSHAQALASDQLARTSAELGQIALIYSQTAPLDTQATFSQSWASGNYVTGGPNSERVVSGETASIPPLNTSSKVQLSTYADIGSTYVGGAANVPIQTPGGSGVSSYALTFAPIVIAPNMGSISIAGSNWTAIQGTYYAGPTLTNQPDVPPTGNYDPTDVLKASQPQFEVDLNAGKLALPLEYGYGDVNAQVREGIAATSIAMPQTAPTYIQTFRITISTMEGTVTSGACSAPVTLHTYTGTMTIAPVDVTYGPVRLDATYHSLWFDPLNLPSANGSGVVWDNAMAPSSPNYPPCLTTAGKFVKWTGVTLRRDFQLASSFSGDPYQYRLEANLSNSSVYFGVIHFNPWATILKDTTNKSVRFVADYVMADTRILCEDHSATASSVRVDAPSILQFGDPIDQGDSNGAGTTYQGLIDSRLGMGSTTNDIVVYDLDQGVRLASGDFSTNYSAGRVQLGDNYAGTDAHLRIFYRARHLWSVMFQKSAANYQYGGVFSSSAIDHTNSANLAQYWLAANATGNTRLYFPLTDVGKTINIGGLTITNADGTSKAIVGAGNWKIIAPDSTMTGLNVGYVDLAQNRNEDGNPNGLVTAGQSLLDNSGSGPASSVTGGSVTVRITYMENNSWRHQDVTSFTNSAT